MPSPAPLDTLHGKGIVSNTEFFIIIDLRFLAKSESRSLVRQGHPDGKMFKRLVRYLTM